MLGDRRRWPAAILAGVSFQWGVGSIACNPIYELGSFPCAKDGTCPYGSIADGEEFRCVAGMCRRDCSLEDVCQEGEACSDASLTLLSYCLPACDLELACPDGLTCIGSVGATFCIECLSTSDCPKDKCCMQGFCEEFDPGAALLRRDSTSTRSIT